MNQQQRLHYLKRTAALSNQDIKIIQDPFSVFNFDDANRMIENAIGMIVLPLGIATNFVINGKEYVLPMAIEEPSVIAASSKAAKIAKIKGGFTAEADRSLMIGQVQLVSLPISAEAAKEKILANEEHLLNLANSKTKTVTAKDLEVRRIHDKSQNKMGEMLVVELIIDTQDAMGANAINTMCETIAPGIEELTGGRAILKILSNYATRRLVKCKAIFDKNELGGEQIVKRILYAYAFAYADKDGTYRSLTRWYKTKDGDLAGEIELPMAVGTVGGIASVHPIAKVALKILDVKTSQELAMVLSAIGLAQNLAAIRALASEGIQIGHMKLHARNIAVMAGAKGNMIDIIANRIAEENSVNINRAKEILESLLSKTKQQTKNVL